MATGGFWEYECRMCKNRVQVDDACGHSSDVELVFKVLTGQGSPDVLPSSAVVPWPVVKHDCGPGKYGLADLVGYAAPPATNTLSSKSKKKTKK